MNIRSPRDFWSGALFTGVGLAAILLARSYPLGTAFKMGPGFFPTLLAGLLVLVGVATMARGVLRPGDALSPLSWKPVLLVVGSTLIFGLLIRGAGLLVAAVVLAMVSAMASAHFRWRPALMLAVALAIFCALLFVKGLGLPLPIVGPWLGG